LVRLPTIAHVGMAEEKEITSRRAETQLLTKGVTTLQPSRRHRCRIHGPSISALNPALFQPINNKALKAL
jgi:hypothetical protein